jgi:hypothetical protein
MNLQPLAEKMAAMNRVVSDEVFLRRPPDKTHAKCIYSKEGRKKFVAKTGEYFFAVACRL